MVSKVKYNENGFPYYEGLPPNTKKVYSADEFYKMKKNKRKFSIDNLEIKVGEYFLTQASKDNNIFYLRQVHSHLNINYLKNHISHGQIFMFKK